MDRIVILCMEYRKDSNVKEHFELHLGQVGLKYLWDQYSEMPAGQLDMQACAQKEV